MKAGYWTPVKDIITANIISRLKNVIDFMLSLSLRDLIPNYTAQCQQRRDVWQRTLLFCERGVEEKHHKWFVFSRGQNYAKLIRAHVKQSQWKTLLWTIFQIQCMIYHTLYIIIVLLWWPRGPLPKLKHFRPFVIGFFTGLLQMTGYVWHIKLFWSANMQEQNIISFYFEYYNTSQNRPTRNTAQQSFVNSLSEVSVVDVQVFGLNTAHGCGS